MIMIHNCNLMVNLLMQKVLHLAIRKFEMKMTYQGYSESDSPSQERIYQLGRSYSCSNGLIMNSKQWGHLLEE